MRSSLDQAPPKVPPFDPGLPFWRFWNKDFTHPVTPFPTDHLLGKTTLEYSVLVAAVYDEHGHGMTAADEEALRLAHEHPLHDYLEGYGDYEQWAA